MLLISTLNKRQAKKKDQRTLRPRKQVRFYLCWKQYIKKVVFKYPKVSQCDNRYEFKIDMTKLLEQRKVGIRRTITKYKHTHTAFVEALNKKLEKQLFKPMDAQELQDLQKVSGIWIKNLNSIVSNMNNIESSMIAMKPTDAIKLGVAKLDELEKHPEENLLSKMVYADIYISLVNNMGIKKDRLLTLSAVNIHTG